MLENFVYVTVTLKHPWKSRDIGLCSSSRSSGRKLGIIDESSNLDETMANFDIDVIYKSLRVMPEFVCNPHILTRFINLCDQLDIAHLDITPEHKVSNLALINGILYKVTGPVARLIISKGILENWQCIRNALINNFADHRDETALYSDLFL